MPAKAPPLTVWLYAVGILIGILGLAYVASAPPSSFPDEMPERLTKTESPDKAFRIVLIGTSLTGFGFYQDSDMEAYAQARGMPALEFYRLARSGRNLARFNTLFDALRITKPNLVFIEEKLLFYTNPQLGPWQDRIQRIKGFFHQIILQRKLLPVINTDHLYIRDSDVHDWLKQVELQARRTDYQAAASMVRDRRDFTPTPALHKFLVRARTHNIPVVLLGLPFAREVEALYPQKDRQYEQQIRQLYVDTYGMDYLPFTEELGEDHFGDLFHANLKGRERLSAWFVEQLRTWAP